jgi:RING finger protein 113A
MASTEVKVPFFKKGKSRPTTSRQRSQSPSGNEPQSVASSSKSAVVLPSRKAPANLLSAGTKRTVSQRAGYDDPDAPEKDGPDVKWTAEGSHVNAALDILAGDEAEELLAKRRRKERADAGEEDEEMPDDGQYRGQNAYHSHLKKSSEVPKAMRVGPQRSTTTIRTVTIVDYQPDVCKDYKGMFHCFFWYLSQVPDAAPQKPAIVGSETLANFFTTAVHVRSPIHPDMTATDSSNYRSRRLAAR